MIVYFTDHEKEWIERKDFNIKIKKGCPEMLKEGIQKKIIILKKYKLKNDKR